MSFIYLQCFFTVAKETKESAITPFGQTIEKFMVGENITVQAFTWNMGNQQASNEAVTELFKQVGDPRPDIIAISTQEELAPEGKRLQDRLLAELNQDLSKESQYVLVETDDPQYHTTMAGANNSARTLALSLVTSQNRVSSAVLVKKPYELKDAKASIDFELGKKKNKSVITIKGKLTKDNKELMDISISGGHLNARSDQKRRAHADKFLEREGLKKERSKSFNEIYEEASTFRLIMGDFNERDYLMKNGNVIDKNNQTNFSRYGYDMGVDPSLQMDGKSIHGTYGFTFTSKGQILNKGDPRGRENVAKGGFLDRVAFTCGLKVKSSKYGSNLDKTHFQSNQKGKWLFHSSDHLPVVRSFEVTAPRALERTQIVGDYVKKRLPQMKDIDQDIHHLEQLLECADMPRLKGYAQGLMYHDAKESEIDFLKAYAGIKTPKESWDRLSDGAKFNKIKDALKEKLEKKREMKNNLKEVEKRIEGAVQRQDNNYLTHVFNLVSKCQDLKNHAQETRGVKCDKGFEAQKSALIEVTNRYADEMLENALAKLNGKPLPYEASTLEIQAFSAIKRSFISKINNASKEAQEHMSQPFVIPPLSKDPRPTWTPGLVTSWQKGKIQEKGEAPKKTPTTWKSALPTQTTTEEETAKKPKSPSQ